MSRHFAFLRAINVGGHTVTMVALRKHLEAAGMRVEDTFIASGNVVFEARVSPSPAVIRRIEAHLHEALGYEVATFVRSSAELATTGAHQPFSRAELDRARAMYVGFLDTPLTAAERRSLQAFATDVDAFATHAREVYWLCRVGQVESTFSNARFEKALKRRSTFRNISTVHRMVAKYVA